MGCASQVILMAGLPFRMTCFAPFTNLPYFFAALSFFAFQKKHFQPSEFLYNNGFHFHQLFNQVNLNANIPGSVRRMMTLILYQMINFIVLGQSADFLKEWGVTPVCFLKNRPKCVGSLKPSMYAISFEDKVVFFKSVFAAESVRSLIH